MLGRSTISVIRVHVYILAHINFAHATKSVVRFNFNILCISHVMCYDVQLFYTHPCRPKVNCNPTIAFASTTAANVQYSSVFVGTCLLCINILQCITDAFEGMKRATCLRCRNFQLILWKQYKATTTMSTVKASLIPFGFLNKSIHTHRIRVFYRYFDL